MELIAYLANKDIARLDLLTAEPLHTAALCI
jgi:hypothetical protein